MLRGPKRGLAVKQEPTRRGFHRNSKIKREKNMKTLGNQNIWINTSQKKKTFDFLCTLQTTSPSAPLQPEELCPTFSSHRISGIRNHQENVSRTCSALLFFWCRFSVFGFGFRFQENSEPKKKPLGLVCFFLFCFA